MENYLKISDEAQAFLAEATQSELSEFKICQTDKFGTQVGQELAKIGIAKIIRGGKGLCLIESHIEEFQSQFPKESA